MTMRLVVTATDEDLEKLLRFVNVLTPERERQINLFERAIKWLRASDAYTYGFTHHAQEVSASLVLGDIEQSIGEKSDTGALRQQENSCCS